jgi:hypothetical protein
MQSTQVHYSLEDEILIIHDKILTSRIYKKYLQINKEHKTNI